MVVNVRNLMVGMVLAAAIMTKDGKLLGKPGLVLDERKIELIKNRQDEIEFIEIEGEETTISVASINQAKDSLRNVKNSLSISDVNDMKDAMNTIANEISKNEDAFESNILSYMHEIDTFAHPVRVACLSMVIAELYNKDLKTNNPNIDEKSLINLEDIAMAAVLHNIGEDYKEQNKFNKITKIVNVNIDRLGQHFPGIKDTPLDKYDEKYSSVYSCSIASGMKNISGNTKMMMLLSNEPETGEGCLKLSPEFSKRKDPNIYGAKIIHMCDLYDKLLKETIDGEKASLENVISLIEYYSINGEINREVEQLLINNVKLYPKYTQVLLSTGEIAEVRKSFLGDEQDAYKPIVWTVAPPRRSIDLRYARNITIKSIIGKKNSDLMRQQINSGKKSAINGKIPSEGEVR